MPARVIMALLGGGSLGTLHGLGRKVPKLMQMPLYVWSQSSLLRVLRHPAYRNFVARFPRTYIKFFNDDHLARGLNKQDRAACLLMHYRSLLHYLPHACLAAMPGQEIELMQIPAEERRLTITLGCFDDLIEHEGELVLRLRVDGVEIYGLSFTIAPGRVICQNCEKALLITRVQGVGRELETIRAVTQVLHQTSLSSLLFAALQGVAGGWGICSLAGVSVELHRESDAENRAMLYKAYDAFFQDCGLEANARGYYQGTLPLPQKPLSEIKSGHKIRTRKKRAFRQQVTETVQARMLELLPEANIH